MCSITLFFKLTSKNVTVCFVRFVYASRKFKTINSFQARGELLLAWNTDFVDNILYIFSYFVRRTSFLKSVIYLVFHVPLSYKMQL